MSLRQNTLRGSDHAGVLSTVVPSTQAIAESTIITKTDLNKNIFALTIGRSQRHQRNFLKVETLVKETKYIAKSCYSIKRAMLNASKEESLLLAGTRDRYLAHLRLLFLQQSS